MGSHIENFEYVELGALNCGWLDLPRKWLFAGEESTDTGDKYPCYAFYVHHVTSGRKVMFDLGLNKDLEVYSPALQADKDIVFPSVPNDAADGLRNGKVDPEAIDTIAYSHVHWDHIGDPGKFPSATVLVGPGSKAVAYPGWPTRDGPFMSYVFEPPSGKVRELSYDADHWTPWGPFEKTFDFFGDGSFLLIDTPGHMPGHLGAIARTGADEYVFMGGDVCHARHFFSPCCGHGWDIGTTIGPAGPGFGMHRDADVARRSISKVGELNRMENVLVAISHDTALVDVIPEFPHLLNGWRAKGLKEAIDKRGESLLPRK